MCRECLVKFHAVKAAEFNRPVKLFKCIRCNTERAFHIGELPAPSPQLLALLRNHRGALKVASACQAGGLCLAAETEAKDAREEVRICPVVHHP